MAAETEIEETRELIASDKVEGTSVFDRDGTQLGTIHNFMVNKRTGQVAYAVLSFGGFLGLGESYHPLPWRMLTYDTGLGGYVVGLTRQELEATPSYPTSSIPDWSEGVVATG